MKVLVIGATGITGGHAIRLLLARGDAVTALARDPDALGEKHELLRVAKGEARDEGSLARAIEGQDAVLSAFGPRSLRKDDLQEVFMRNLVAAMERTNVKRLVNLSAWGAGETRASLPFVGRLVLRYVLNELFADKERGEEILFASALDWVNVRPGRLWNGRARGGVKASLDPEAVRPWPLMTREDLAQFMVDQLDRDEWVRRSPLIGY
jgi:uncharacterized protein YbjT (DUF2867 family)